MRVYRLKSTYNEFEKITILKQLFSVSLTGGCGGGKLASFQSWNFPDTGQTFLRGFFRFKPRTRHRALVASRFISL